MNVRQVRTKIKSVSNIKKITHAMELVSAFKMRKAQLSEIESRPYRDNLENVIHRLVPKIDPSLSPLLLDKEKKSGKSVIIIISSNKGLCGTFHTNIERFILNSVDMEKNDFITVGKKVAQFISRLGGSVVADYSSVSALHETSAIFTQVAEKYLNGTYDCVFVIYNKFISTFSSETVQTVLLPLTISSINADTKAKEPPVEYLVEPSPQDLINPLLHDFVEEKIRGAVISSLAVEHSARMIAMKNATDNANDVIYSLTLLGNQLRQGKITSELLDMITAKESVESSQS